ncbi:FAD-dependent monooxygenase [Agromyces endophyticus]|uniref:FAD-dependent oxidoreductase n=1 Tax=Agromyces sp. H17E-10 TaxID=2932244 RepID=UPI001FD22836|nr:NAD(P)/FAD-dependent oxidoreductase [Agromyces sp. H17E-10]UOQ87640.1 FAD-dependent monooxygenase [Agromyces sp. H17E-10]
MREPSPAAVDVVVIGAGPVGLALACLLAMRGIGVTVLERATAASTRSRAFGVHTPGLGVLDRVGVGAAVRAESAPIGTGRVTCRGRVLGRMRFTEPIRSLPQHRIEALLVDRLEQLAPGALRRGVAAAGLRGVHGGVEVRTETTAEVGSEIVRARLAVAADGVRSPTRRLLGIGWTPRPGRARYVMADVSGGGEVTDDDETAVLRFEPDGVVESFPLPGGHRRVVAWHDGGDPDATAFAALVAGRTGRRFETVGAPSSFTAAQHVATRFAHGRVALAGDAAHEVSPIGGQGMNLGWLDALALADAIERDLARPPGGRRRRFARGPFARYGRRRRRAALRACRRAAFNMAMGAPAWGIPLAVRNAAIRLLGVPPLRGLLAATFTMRGL